MAKIVTERRSNRFMILNKKESFMLQICCRHRYSTSSTALHWPFSALLRLLDIWSDEEEEGGRRFPCKNSVHCCAVILAISFIRRSIPFAILCEATQLIVSSKSWERKSRESAMMQSHCTTGSFAKSSIAQTQEQRRMELTITFMRSVHERMSLNISLKTKI